MTYAEARAVVEAAKAKGLIKFAPQLRGEHQRYRHAYYAKAVSERICPRHITRPVKITTGHSLCPDCRAAALRSYYKNK